MKVTLLIISFAIFGITNAQSASFLWAKSAGGTSYDEGNCISTDANGNVYVTGYFQSPSITFGTTTLTNTGAFDIFVVKYDASGNVLWAKGVGGTKDDVGNGISTDANGNVYVTGFFYSTSITFGTTTLKNHSNSTNDIFIVKYDANGNVLWAKNEGGLGYEFGKSVATDANGNVFVTGNFSSSTITLGTSTLSNTSAFAWDIFVVKYDASGNALWAKGAGGTTSEYANGISTDAKGNVFVTGGFYSASISFGTTTLKNTMANSSDIFVVKYDAGGNVLWAKNEGGTDEDDGYSISTDANGNAFLTGQFKSPSITFGAITLTNNPPNPSTGTVSYDMFVVKYDASGNVLWAKGVGGVDYEVGFNSSTDANGNVYVTGGFHSNSITFGTTTLTNAYVGQWHSDIFVVKYDTNGNVLWAKGVGGIDDDFGHGISADANGNVYVTGYFHSPSIAFGTTTLTNTGGSVFVVKLGGVTTGLDDLSVNSTIKIFPNPFSSSTTLQVNENLKDATLTVYNSFGQIVKEIKNLSGLTVVLSLDNLACGSYFVRLTDENKIYTNKLVLTDK